jgi:hypothetical protein
VQVFDWHTTTYSWVRIQAIAPFGRSSMLIEFIKSGETFKSVNYDIMDVNAKHSTMISTGSDYRLKS